MVNKDEYIDYYTGM